MYVYTLHYAYVELSQRMVWLAPTEREMCAAGNSTYNTVLLASFPGCPGNEAHISASKTFFIILHLAVAAI